MTGKATFKKECELDFRPPSLLEGANIQTLLPRVSANIIRMQYQNYYLRNHSLEHIIPANGKQGFFEDNVNEMNGVRLHGLYTPQPDPQTKPLYIMIHGWEGGYDSAYMASACKRIYKAGNSIFRLHLRDHGPSHHLNRQLFNAARIGEIFDALRYIQKQFLASSYALVGFSMGGGFALRIASRAHDEGLSFRKVFAVCPLISPEMAADAVMSQKIYHKFFVDKWQRSLKLKSKLFDNFIDPEILNSRHYQEITDYFVEHHTPFKDYLDYYSQYTVSQETINAIQVPTYAFIAKDDPVLPVASAANLANTDHVNLIRTQSGGHCGYHSNIFGSSWIDKQLVRLY